MKMLTKASLQSGVAAALIVGLGACATKYVAPEQGPLARVRVAAEYYDGSRRLSYMPPVISTNEGCTAGARMPLHYYSGATDTELKPGNAADVAEFRAKAFSLRMPDAPERVAGKQWGEFKVPAGRPVSFSFHHGYSDGYGVGSTYSNCNVTGIFRFEPDSDYEVSFRSEGGPGRPGGCIVKAEKILTYAETSLRLPIPVLPSCR